jgi:hypothetical protein
MTEFECPHCSQSREQHVESWAENMTDYMLLGQIGDKVPELKETIDRVLSGWRGHALPECDPLALS